MTKFSEDTFKATLKDAIIKAKNGPDGTAKIGSKIIVDWVKSPKPVELTPLETAVAKERELFIKMNISITQTKSVTETLDAVNDDDMNAYKDAIAHASKLKEAALKDLAIIVDEHNKFIADHKDVSNEDFKANIERLKIHSRVLESLRYIQPIEKDLCMLNPRIKKFFAQVRKAFVNGK